MPRAWPTAGMCQKLTHAAQQTRQSVCNDLLDKLVSPNEEGQRHFQPERLGRLKIDRQFDLRRPLDRKIGGVRTFENTINVERSRAVHLDCIRAVPDQCAVPCKCRGAYRREAMASGGTDNPPSMPGGERAGLDDQRCCPGVLYRCNGIVYFDGVKDPSRLKLHTNRFGDLHGRSISVFAVRPSGMPKVPDGPFRVGQLSSDVHQLTADVGKHVAKSGRIASRAG
jgi:hypothetical protein